MRNTVILRIQCGVRGALGFTGLYKGERVSVMGTGMGMPSIGIYSYELFNFYDVKNLVRIGSAGSISDKVHVMDIVLGQGACTNSSFVNTFKLPGTFAPIADWVGMILPTVTGGERWESCASRWRQLPSI